MGKFEEVVSVYKAEADKIGLKVNDALLSSIAKSLGPSLYKADSAKVAFSDKAELDRVKKNFCVKKLGLADDDKLDKALAEIKEKFGASNRNKYRALTYYMLVKKFKKEDLFA